MRTLREIGESLGTDKITVHRYETAYAKVFEGIRENVAALLEIGVAGGASLRMWEEYFPNARIYGIDVEPQCLAHQGGRRRVFIGSSGDREFLTQVVQEIGAPLDLVIDDGSHRMPELQIALSRLFPHVRPGGWYVVEDLETSYYPTYGGGLPGVDGTFVHSLKSLLDQQQYAYHERSETYFSRSSDAVSWVPLVPVECQSRRGARLDRDCDHWIAASGMNPPYDLYVARFRARPGMTGIQLRIDSGAAPGDFGPGRADNGNFALTEAILHLHGQNWGRPLAVRHAAATFEQTGFPARSVRSPSRDSAWAVYPQLADPQALTLVLARRSEPDVDAELTIILRQASVPFHNIRRFSVWATDSDLLFRADGQPVISSVCSFPNIVFLQRG